MNERGVSIFKFSLISDLHFGAVPDGLAAALIEDLAVGEPRLVVIAGDLTMRARSREFEAARDFISALGLPLIVLPGNHDLPHFNLWERFTQPYRRFADLAQAVINPVHDAGHVVIAGLNTTRSWQPHPLWQEGVVRPRDALAAAQTFEKRPASVFKAVVTHHPLVRAQGLSHLARPALGARRAVKILIEAGAALFMSGHVHRSYCQEWLVGGRRLLAVGAPTALSTRLRGEENGYWAISVDGGAVTLSLRRRQGSQFHAVKELRYDLTAAEASGEAKS